VRGNPSAVQLGATFGNLAPSTIIAISAASGAITPLTDSAASNASPAWLGDSRALLFVSEREGTRDIYMTTIGSRSAPVRLTLGLSAQSISISPETNRIAYAVYTERSNVWTIPIPSGQSSVTTAAARQLTSGNQIVESVTASRDGHWILYDATIAGNAEIYRVPSGGGSPEQLTRDGGQNFRPDLSPDGSEVVFHSWRRGNRDLFIQRLGGSAAEPLTTSPLHEGGPVWSPDGRRVAYEGVEADNGLWVMTRAADGRWSKAKFLTSTDPSSPAWSRDGRSLAFVLNGVLGVVPSDSGAVDVRYTPSANDPKPEQAVWDRTESGFYFKAHDAFGRASIWWIGAHGGTPRRVVLFDDLSRPSYRFDCAMNDAAFFFPVQDRQSDVWTALLVRR